MTISARALTVCVSLAVTSAAPAVEPPLAVDQGAAPETIRVTSAEAVAAGEEGHKFAFMLIKADSGRCYAVVPPGGEGMAAGDAYAVVAASDVDDTTRTLMTKDHPGCTVVNVVARVAR